MEVKGAAFVGRKDAIIKKFGEDAWTKFIKSVAEKEPFFANSVLSNTLIPAEKFLFFQDEVVKTFYNNDQKANWISGEQAAEYSLVNGPYKIYLQTKDLKMFVEERLPAVMKMYYTEGQMEGKVNGKVVDVIITGVPIQHVYFEYTIMGYAKRAIELLGAKIVNTKVLKGAGMGTKDSHYQFTIE